MPLAVEPAALVAERLKDRIWTELFPSLVEDVLDSGEQPSRRRAFAPQSLIEAEHAARTLLLRLMILSFAAGRGLTTRRSGIRASWRRIQRWAAGYRPERSHAREPWRQWVDRCLRSYFHATGRSEELVPRVSPAVLGRVIDGLSRDVQDDPNDAAWIDYRTLDIRLLGDVHEGLLALALDKQTGRLVANTQGRKASGSFYTDETIVNYVVEQTLDPLLARHAAQLKDRPTERTLDAVRTVAADLLSLRVIDPAMGCGFFLLVAVRRIATHLKSVCGFTDPMMDRWLLRRAARSAYGLDIDPLAVELAQASLWLECGLDRRGMLGLGERLRCGNALLGESVNDLPGTANVFAGQFDAVVGNPPYGAKLSAAERRRACQQLPQMRHNSNTAVGFIESSHRWLAPRGRCGLIVPKALTYSFAWRRLREYLAGRVVELVDVSQFWPEVRLEQVIVLSAADSECSTYHSRIWRDGTLSPRLEVNWKLADRLAAWPCGLTRTQQRFVSRLSRREATVGDLCRTFRGLPLQADVRPAGTTAILGGRDLMRWRVRSISGYASQNVELSRFAGERLLFQNIVAHLMRPHPHLRLIGCHDSSGRPTLDTVNNLVARRDDIDLHGLLGLLHSRFVNWYLYAVIYNQAVRTMHFDQYFLGKIPLPAKWQQLIAGLAPLSRTMQDFVSGEPGTQDNVDHTERCLLTERRQRAESKINELVNDAYGWRSPAE